MTYFVNKDLTSGLETRNKEEKASPPPTEKTEPKTPPALPDFDQEGDDPRGFIPGDIG